MRSIRPLCLCLSLALLGSAVLTSCRNGTEPTETDTGAQSSAPVETQTEQTDPDIPETEDKTMTQYNHFITDLSTFPLSFTYDGTPYTGFGADFCETARESRDNGRGGTATVITMTHTSSGAEFRLETAVYPGYSAWDYTLYITNKSGARTGVFSDINAVDLHVRGSDPAVKGISGDCGKDMYSPYEQKLRRGRDFVRESVSGRPTHGVFPYFKLEYGEGGSFVCIGWSGTWRAQAQAEDGGARFTGGQRGLATYLEPGETIRTPLIAILNYDTRDDIRNANLWRRWFIDCNMRRVDGELMPPMFTDWTMSQGTSTDRIVRKIRGYENHGVPLDCYWMDAGWYTNASGQTVEWTQTGTLAIDESRFPDHFKDISAELKRTGGKLLLWFEPEVVRVDKQQFLDNIPDFKEEWMLGTALPGTWLEGQLLDLGNEDCRAWIANRIHTILRDADIAVYRQDFNVDPAPVWQQHDSEGRTGFCENQYVMGYLALWDGIIEAFPSIWIDSCASGGGRNDLETMRRSVPLQISDYWDGGLGDPSYDGYDERQATMLTVMQWFPYIKYWIFGDDSVGSLTYRARTCFTQCFPLSVNTMSKDTDWELVRKLVDEWRMVSSYCYDDFYPLTPWDNSTTAWRAYEYFDPDKNSGAAQVFRPSESKEDTKTIRLMGVKPDAVYHVYDTDGTFDTTVTGQELLETGLTLTLPEARYAMVLCIEGK